MASPGQEHGAAADAPVSSAPEKDAAAAAGADPTTTTAESKDGPATAPKPNANVRPEREATFKDYIRIFSYAKKWDYVLIVAATIASIGAGTVSHPAPAFTPKTDNR